MSDKRTNDRRTRNAEIFKDTEMMYKTNVQLIQAVKDSRAGQELIPEGMVVDYEGARGLAVVAGNAGECQVVVSGKRTLEAAKVYANQGKKVCILNFASATNPGGGVVHGSSAQEEAICRCTTLYPCLNNNKMWDGFYMPHRELNNPLYNNDCIYTPDVVVFKSDTDFPETMPESQWWKVDVITCAAPNLRRIPSNEMNPNAGSEAANISLGDLRELLRGRITRIFQVAMRSGAQVLILGAFGCGAFKNPPKLVAEVFGEVMKEYGGEFEVIEYAVYHTEREKGNYEAFRGLV